MKTKGLVLLLATAFLLCAAKIGDPRNEKRGNQTRTQTENKKPSSAPVATFAELPHPHESASHSAGETYNYYGDFNYIPQQTDEGFWTKHGTAVAGITAILITLLTAGLVYVGKQAANAAQSSADAARDQLESTKIANEQNIKLAQQSADATKQTVRIAELALRAERPYVLIDEIRIIGTEPPPSHGGLANLTDEGEERRPILCTVRFRNFGKGTARIIKIVGKVTIQEDWPQENVRGTQTHGIEKGAVPAGELLSFEMARGMEESLYLTRPEFNSLDDRTTKLVAYGALVYGDVTGEQVYFTNFAWHFAPWPPVLRMFKTQTAEWHGEGNVERGPQSLNAHT